MATVEMVVPVEIINPKTGESMTVNCRIDTGADVSAICIFHADKIGIGPKRFCTVLDADGDPLDAPVFEIDVNIQGCRLSRVEVVGLDFTRSNCGGLIGNNILDEGLLVRSGNSWSFVIGENTCAAGWDARYLLAGLFGLVLGAAGALLLTRK